MSRTAVEEMWFSLLFRQTLLENVDVGLASADQVQDTLDRGFRVRVRGGDSRLLKDAGGPRRSGGGRVAGVADTLR